MKIQEHIDKISWTVADKSLYLLYGLVSLFQIRHLNPNEYGLFALMISLHTWIFIVVDSFALQSIIQFGAIKEDRPKVNLFALILQISFAMIFPLMIYLLRFSFSEFFKQPRLIEASTLLPFLVLLTLPRTYCIKLIYRDQEYSKLFMVNLAFFGAMALFTIYYIFFVHNFNFEKMVALYFFGTAASSLLGIILTFPQLKFGLKGKTSFKAMLKFALPYTLYSGIQYIPKQLDVFLVQYFFSTATVGIYNSAKTLFRVFDESINASFGLVYPPAVKLIASGDKKGLKDLMTKAVSFLLVFILIGVVLLESGLSHLIITFFIPKYAMAIGQFNVLLFAAIALPFTLLSTILIAEGKPWLMVLFVSISVTCSLITFYIVGSLASPNLIPLGIVVNASVNGFLCLIYSRKHYGFSYSFVFRAVGDSVNFAKSYINKRKSK